MDEILKRKFLKQCDNGVRFFDYENISFDSPKDVTFLHELANSKNYFDGFMLVYCLENMTLKELRNHYTLIQPWLKQALQNYQGRIRYYLMLLYFEVLQTKEDDKYFVTVLYEMQNEPLEIDLLLRKFLNYKFEMIQRFKKIDSELFAPFDWSEAEFNRTNYLSKINHKSAIHKKLFAVASVRADIEYFKILEIVDDYENHDMMDFIYVVLDRS